jgi:hypothetical protein
VTPGSFVVHPPGALHAYANGPQRTLLFYVRYGADMQTAAIPRSNNPRRMRSIIARIQ